MQDRLEVDRKNKRVKGRFKNLEASVSCIDELPLIVIDVLLEEKGVCFSTKFVGPLKEDVK